MTHRAHRLDGEGYVASLERDGSALAAAAEGRLGDDVPSCPGWNVEELVWHMGSVFHFWGSIARDRMQDPAQVLDVERPAPDELLSWYRTTFQDAVEALRSGDPTAAVWTWAAEKNIAWIRRRMAHETAVHRWDAQSATGGPEPIDATLARDGIDEFFELFVRNAADAQDVRVHLHATDADGEWIVTIDDGQLDVQHEHAKGDVAVRGKASDLLLLLWGRVPEAAVEVHGDRLALFNLLEIAELD